MSDYTAKQLLDGRFTFNQVDDMVYDGRLSVEVANQFFQEWSKGKSEHRWNAELARPEECISTPCGEVWRELRWSK